MADRVIYGSRRKAALLFLGCALFTASGFVLKEPSPWGFLGTAFFGLGTVVGLYQVLHPNRLTLSEDDFSVRVGFRSYRVRWDDIEAFHLWQNPAAMQRLVGWTYKTGRGPRNSLRRISAALGADSALPGIWSLSPEDLRGLMNRYLQAVPSDRVG